MSDLILGAVLGAFVSWWFAAQSSKELRAETKGLHERLRTEAESLRDTDTRSMEMTNTLARAFEEAGLIEVTWDEKGFLKGIVVHGEFVKLPIVPKVMADGYVTPGPRRPARRVSPRYRKPPAIPHWRRAHRNH